jgi:hypothetical protein
MGFFSWNCCSCNQSIVNFYVAKAFKEVQWLSEISVIGHNADYLFERQDEYILDDGETVRVAGCYSGYGGIDGEDIELVDLNMSTVRIFHDLCWHSVGSPGYHDAIKNFPANCGDQYQGHFVDEGVVKRVKKPAGFSLY